MRQTSFGTFLRGVLAVFIALAAMTMLALQATPASAGDGNPAVTVEIVAPAQVVYGHRPFTMKVRLTNVTEEAFTFDGTVKIGGPAWGQENYPYAVSVGTSVYNTVCSYDCTYYWKGALQPGQQAEFILPTFSGNVLGGFNFAEVNMPLSTGQTVGADRGITLVTDPKSANVPVTVTTSPAGSQWPRGESRQVVITARYSTLTQLNITKILSKGGCEIAGLSLKNGVPNRTEESFTYYLQMPTTAAVGADCAIVVQVTTSDGHIGYQNGTFKVV